MKINAFLLTTLLLFSAGLFAQRGYTLNSPDQKITVTINASASIAAGAYIANILIPNAA